MTAIATADEATSLANNTSTYFGTASVVLDATDNGWSVADDVLDTALAAGIKVAAADALTAF